MATSTKITAILEADDRTKQGFDSAAGGMNKLGAAAKAIGGVLAVAFAAEKVIEFGKKSVEAFIESERAARQLEHAVIDISKGTKEQVTAINDLSDALQKKAGIDGDALKAGAAQLSTFGLQSKSVVDLTKSLADLTVNQNGVNASADQYIQSANIMAKALNGQFGVLEKSGIRFTEAQQSMILYGTETEKVAALQAGLSQNLRETTDTIGSSAEGAAARSKAAFGEIQENVGSLIVEGLTPLNEAFAQLATAVGEGMPSSMADLKESFGSFLENLDAQTGLVTMLGDAWDNVVFVFNTQLMPALTELWVALQPFMPILDAMVKVFGTMLVVAIGAAILIFQALALVLVGLITGVAKVYTAIYTNLVKPFEAVGEAILWVITQVEKLIAAFKKLDVVQGVKDLGKKITGKAVGGSVSAGTPYMVGEVGPELFVPASSGSIVPNNKLGGSGTTINVNISDATFMGKEGIADKIGKEIAAALGLRMKLS